MLSQHEADRLPRSAIVLSGSPLFSGQAGSGESEIRRWILENDWLEGIVALPDQMFYNTGISTYVWILTNDKADADRGTVKLVDARELGTKMRKSLGDKRKELTPAAIDEIARLYGGARRRVRRRPARQGARATRRSASSGSPSSARCVDDGRSPPRPSPSRPTTRMPVCSVSVRHRAGAAQARG